MKQIAYLAAAAVVLFAQTPTPTILNPNQLVPDITQTGVLVAVPDIANPGKFMLEVAQVTGCLQLRPAATVLPATFTGCSMAALTYGEVLTGGPTSWTFQHVPNPTQMGCYRNGSRMQLGADFTMVLAPGSTNPTNTIAIPMAQAGDSIQCDYVQWSPGN